MKNQKKRKSDPLLFKRGKQKPQPEEVVYDLEPFNRALADFYGQQSKGYDLHLTRVYSVDGSTINKPLNRHEDDPIRKLSACVLEDKVNILAYHKQHYNIIAVLELSFDWHVAGTGEIRIKSSVFDFLLSFKAVPAKASVVAPPLLEQLRAHLWSEFGPAGAPIPGPTGAAPKPGYSRLDSLNRILAHFCALGSKGHEFYIKMTNLVEGKVQHESKLGEDNNPVKSIVASQHGVNVWITVAFENDTTLVAILDKLDYVVPGPEECIIFNASKLRLKFTAKPKPEPKPLSDAEVMGQLCEIFDRLGKQVNNPYSQVKVELLLSGDARGVTGHNPQVAERGLCPVRVFMHEGVIRVGEQNPSSTVGLPICDTAKQKIVSIKETPWPELKLHTDAMTQYSKIEILYTSGLAIKVYIYAQEIEPAKQPEALEEFQTKFVDALNNLVGDVNKTGNKTLILTRHYNDGQMKHVAIKGPFNFVTRRLDTTEPGRQVLILDVTEEIGRFRERFQKMKAVFSAPIVSENEELHGNQEPHLYDTKHRGYPLRIVYKDGDLRISVEG